MTPSGLWKEVATQSSEDHTIWVGTLLHPRLRVNDAATVCALEA